MKICRDCGQNKLLKNFNKSTRAKDGKQTICKECQKIRIQKFQRENPDYREKNKEKIREQNRRWYEANREKQNKYKKEWKRTNPEKTKESSKRHNIHNREKIRKTQRLWRENNQEKIKDYAFKYRFMKYGITAEKYQTMLEIQNNQCAICKQEFQKSTCIDHDHSCCPGAGSCGKCVRGIICNDCNVGLGRFKDNPRILQEAIDYLETGIRRR